MLMCNQSQTGYKKIVAITVFAGSEGAWRTFFLGKRKNEIEKVHETS